MLANRICNLSWQLFTLHKTAAVCTICTANCDTPVPAKTLYLLMASQAENMLCLNFITANVKNNTSYLKTNVLKKC